MLFTRFTCRFINYKILDSFYMGARYGIGVLY